MSEAARRSFEIKGWHVLTAMLAFFGVVIAVNVVFAIFAINSFPGEDVRRSYLQGLQYNQTLAERRSQAELGWRAEARLIGEGSGAAVEVSLVDRDGRPIDGAVVTGALQWPMDVRRDRAIEFSQIGAGRYAAQVRSLEHGRWRLRAHAQRGEDAFDLEAELTWQTSR